MMKICFLLLIVAVNSGCARVESQANQKPDNAPIATASQPLPTPTELSRLNKKDQERLDEQFPKRPRDILESAQLIQVYETEVCTPGKGYTLSPNDEGQFQGCRILRQADVTAPELRKELLDGIRSAIASPDASAACFSPRHGVRAEHDGKRVELLICFECSNFRGSFSEGNFAGGISDTVKGLFERLLKTNKGSGK